MFVRASLSALFVASLGLGIVACAGEDASTSQGDDELVGRSCGGFAGLACPEGLECIDKPNDGCDPAKGGRDCIGVCVKPAADASAPRSCGGFAGLPCPSGQSCIDKPNDGCDPTKGGRDCIGICVDAAVKDAGAPSEGGQADAAKPPICGGFAGIRCPEGLTCVDDPSDGCDPKGNGRDCIGICVK